MSLNDKMTAIADAIREKTGGTDPLSLDAMAAAVPTVYAAGKSAAEALCDATHFAGTVRGSGTGTLSVPIPFEPDTLLIVAANMRIFTYQIAVCVYTPHALGKYLGGVQTTQNSLSLGAAAIRRDQRMVSYADGVLTFTMVESVPVRFDANTDYIVLASKTETRTDKEILTDFVSGLADVGGTVTLSQAAINAAVTDDEWAALLATKPNWTFTLI